MSECHSNKSIWCILLWKLEIFVGFSSEDPAVVDFAVEIAMGLLEWQAIVDYAVDNGQKGSQFFYFVDFAVDIDKIVNNAVDIEESLQKWIWSGYCIEIDNFHYNIHVFLLLCMDLSIVHPHH